MTIALSKSSFIDTNGVSDRGFVAKPTAHHQIPYPNRDDGPFINHKSDSQLWQTRLCTLLVGLVGILPLNAQTTYPFQNPNMAPDKRIDNLVSLLTVDEKIGLITDFAVPRLGISSPGNAESIHQVKLYTQPGQTKKPLQTTSFAQVYGMGETWNLI